MVRITFAILSLLMLTLSLNIALAQTPGPQELQDLLNNISCQQACFMGIEPGRTTQTQVKNYFSTADIQYQIFAGIQGDDEGNGIYYWGLDPSTEFFNPAYNLSSAIVFSNSVVRQIELVLTVPTSVILATYGNPVFVLKADHGSYYYMVYPNNNIVFQIDTAFSSQNANLIFLVTDDALVKSFINDSPLQPCVNPADICSIANTTPQITATATLTSLPTLTPTITPVTPVLSAGSVQQNQTGQNPTLRSLLHSPGCQTACFLGIQPGVTSQTQLENNLSNLNIMYEVSTASVTSFYNFDASSVSSSLISSEIPALIIVGVDTVSEINIPLNGVMASDVTNMYGMPSLVANFGGGGSNYLVYPAQGLVFVESSQGDIVLVIIRSRQGISSYTNGAPCTSISPLCSIPTATPTPLPTLTPSPTPTPTITPVAPILSPGVYEQNNANINL
jgi:hypothetical protein